MAKRRLKRAWITRLAFCQRAANQLPTLMKSRGKDGKDRVHLQTLSKMDDEGLLHTLVYLPEREDFEGDIADADVIKSAAHEYLLYGGQLDIEHDGRVLTKDQAHIAESFIVQRGDPRFADWTDYDGNKVDPTDGWGVVIKVKDPEIRRLYKEEGWNGISMWGDALVEDIEKSEKGKAMDPKELADAIATGISQAFAAREEAATAAAKENEPTIEKSVTQVDPAEFDLTTEEGVLEYKDALFVSGLDMQNPADVEKLHKHIKEKAERAQSEEKKADSEGDETEELAKARKEAEAANARVAKLEKSTGIDVSAGDETEEVQEENLVGLSKSESKQRQMGLELARKFLRSRGHKVPAESK